MQDYVKKTGPQWAQLEILLKSIKVIVTYHDSETCVRRLKTINGFATPGDGENLINKSVIAK